MNDYVIAASILSADFAQLGADTKAALKAGADFVHVDVMDNHYVPNLTFGPIVVKALRNAGIKQILDVHLMIKPVDAIIPAFAEAGANYITFHPEASEHVDRTLQLIRDVGCKPGLALNPATSLDVLQYTLDKIDMLLIMSVNPGFGGQSFISGMLNKIETARSLIDASGRPIRLEVDGGVNADNIAEIAAFGADTFVSGSAIFKSNDYQETLETMRKKLAIG